MEQNGRKKRDVSKEWSRGVKSSPRYDGRIFLLFHFSKFIVDALKYDKN